MIFLKRIEAYGFKSFAKPTKIIFDHGMVGVVGPNGSGKSNINDAIRWVLGEQSIKSLRGDNLQDIIFQGSKEHPQLNMAEVKLIFNNKQRIFPLDFDEVEISRRIYRSENENEYAINKTKVRLKDVQELVLGTGLSKGSLAIINQGNVANFSQAKPEERRLLFEEAANVSKYKKRKLESLRKLEKVEQNLTRINDIIIELEKNVNYLKRQAIKAQTYVTKKEQLTTIEVMVLINDISSYYELLHDLQNDVKNYENKTENLNFQIVNYETSSNSLQEKIFMVDNKIQHLGKELDNYLQQLETLQNEKLTLKSVAPDNIQEKATWLIQENVNYQQLIRQQKEMLEKQEAAVSSLKEQRISLNEELEVAVKKYNVLSQEIYELKLKKDHLVDLQTNTSHYYHGVKTILNNQENLTGIVATIDQLITVPEKFQLAIQEALSSSMQHIVVDTANDAVNAIQFLKANQAGVATFLPLDSLKINPLNNDDVILLQAQKGFIGLASQLLSMDDKYERVIKFLLGRIIIVDDLVNAKNIAHITYRKHHIITLQGDVIRAGGSITGGFKKVKQFLFKNEEQIKFLANEIKVLEDSNQNYHHLWQELKNKLLVLNNELEQKQTYLGRLQQIYQTDEQKAIMIQKEYEHLTNQNLPDNTFSDDKKINLDQKIANFKLARMEINEQLAAQRNLRENYRKQLFDISEIAKKLRFENKIEEKKLQELNINKIKIDHILQQNLQRLATEYRLTFEYAVEKYGQKEIVNEIETRKQIIILKKELEAIGNVNIDAIAEYEDVKTRYEFLKEQKNELVKGQKQLLSAIKDMDEIMVTRFDQTMKDINKVLPETFKVLFAGGTARLEYSDPCNILETGIEIIVNLPGKIITNLNLLSGGEKSLVALSVLFAILKARPLPLVILDEVEAPLDVANVERFAKYLKTFTKQTQFIVITHRPGTMENCDSLYGTTMQTKGVTKMVMIKLEEAQKFSQPNN